MSPHSTLHNLEGLVKTPTIFNIERVLTQYFDTSLLNNNG